MAGLLQAFITHAEAHFGLENTWMEETGFPRRGTATSPSTRR